MTPTPRTDETMKYCFGDDREFVPADFARQLERELAAANAIIASALKAMPVGYIPAHTPESLPGRVADIVDQYAEAERELAEMTARAVSLVVHVPPQTLAGDLQKWRDNALKLLEGQQ